ncbi:MAG: leucine-rich repeat protein [Lachnospiraceae bacterium]|nr:leucine-rich repeat protein [Lachnospiraceae bacterium]
MRKNKTTTFLLAVFFATMSFFSMNSYAENVRDDYSIVNLSEDSDEESSNGTWGDNLTWTLSEDTLTISGKGDMADYHTIHYHSEKTSSLYPWNDFSFSKVIIEKGVTSVARCAFNGGCSYRDIEEVEIANTVTKIESGAFMYLKIKEVYIPESVNEIGSGAFEASAYTISFTVDKNNSYYKDSEGVLYTKDGKTLVAFPGAREGSYIVEEGTETVDSFSFENAHISEIKFPDSLKTIGMTAFANSEICGTVNIPHGVETISSFAFDRCKSIKKVSVPSTVKNWGTFVVFGELPALEEVSLEEGITELPVMGFAYCENLKRIDIPEGIKNIPSTIFMDCSSLNEIHIPSSTETISPSSFDGIDEKATVYYNGTEKEWSKIDFGEENPINSKKIIFISKDNSTDNATDNDKTNIDEDSNQIDSDEVDTDTTQDDNSYKKYGLDDNYVPDGYEDKSGSPMIVDGLDCSWNEVSGKSYWYEAGIKQGTYYDPKGVIGDGTNRGREICDMSQKDDAGQDGVWYWLDSIYDGAKATGKEVWMPYIYQNEDEWDDESKRNIAYESDEGMGECVYNAIKNKSGKWVRYDENGKMLKGWVKIEGALATLYPDQAGNTYYYDHRTGLMAKGEVTIDGQKYCFNEITGALE